MITVELPGALQPFAEDRAAVKLTDGYGTVGAALAALGERYGGVTDRVLDERGAIRQHVNVFVDGENVRFLEGLRTPLQEGSVIVIFPAVSGG